MPPQASTGARTCSGQRRRRSHAPVDDHRGSPLVVPPEEALHPEVRVLHRAETIRRLRVHYVGRSTT
eukprot:2651612-Pleurochrysis_carterae.AAC.1